METITEWCPHCGDEVELKEEMVRQVCPNCKEKILPCSMCFDMNYMNCGACPIE